MLHCVELVYNLDFEIDNLLILQPKLGGDDGDDGRGPPLGGGGDNDDNGKGGDDDDYFGDFDGDEGDDNWLFRRRIVLQEVVKHM